MKALFCQPEFSIFEFYASNYASVFVFKYQSNLGRMPPSFGVADVAVKEAEKVPKFGSQKISSFVIKKP